MVKLTIKPISKLTILFLFFIFIPGLILSYFSIQNIANQKELTEKRLSEEQNELATILARNFHKQLQEYTIEFFKTADSLDTELPKRLFILDSLDFVDRAFIVDTDGKFISPYYLYDSRYIQTLPISRNFFKAFSKAEKLEFTKADFRGATIAYKNAFKIARYQNERAIAINGLARVLTKRELNDQAQKQYIILAEQFGTEIDNTGIPFAYYSLHQLNRKSITSPDEYRYKNIKLILSYLNNGKIPITDHVEMLLEELYKQISTQTFLNQKLKGEITYLINSIRKKFLFITPADINVVSHVA